MKTNIRQILLITAVACLITTTAQARKKYGPIALGARYHQEHSIYEAMPFGDGDFSYGLFYEAQDGNGILQFGVSFASDVSGSTLMTDTGDNDIEPIDQVFTPEINMLFRDGGWLFGVGMLMNYIEINEDVGVGQEVVAEALEQEEDDWSDLYWQMLLGYRFNLGGSELNVMAYYPYEDWGDLGDIDFDDFNYGGQWVFRF